MTKNLNFRKNIGVRMWAEFDTLMYDYVFHYSRDRFRLDSWEDSHGKLGYH
jgi:hypothetical protein